MAKVVLPLICLLVVIGVSTGTDVLVETTHGRVRGRSSDVAKSFMGIRYATPPLELLRWQPPQPPASWHPEIYDATEEQPGCPQAGCGPPLVCPKKTSEDCLFLNVFAPLNATNGTNLPVMHYIHGGNFYAMSGASPLYNGEVFVQRGNVILVTINYRLGALGFLVTGTGETAARGNYGLYDQALSLKWVKDNIRQFGGDPDKVTLFGQSAGAQSVIQHMTLEESSSYFRSAIIESSPLALPYRNYDEAYTLGGLVAEQAGCPVGDLDCLRGKTADEIVQASQKAKAAISSLNFLEMFEPFGPYIDGAYVKGQPLDVYLKDEFFKKPLMIGTLTEETVLYVYGAFTTPMPVQDYSALVAVVKPEDVLEVLNQYPPSPITDDQREVLVNLTTDALFGCASRNLSRIFVEHAQQDVWLYVWNHALSFPGWGSITFCNGRVCHGAEIVYVFQTAYLGNYTLTPDEVLLSNDVISYWTNFAWSGDPNKSGDKFGSNIRPADQDTSVQFGNDDTIPQRLRKKRGIASKLSGVTHMTMRKENQTDRSRAGALPYWPPYKSNLDWPAMYFQTPQSQTVQNFKDGKCNFFDRIGYHTGPF